MQKQYNPHFPTGKIKKIIQNNQEVGKLANTIPHLMEHSLQIFLNEILENVNEIASEEDYSKITPALLQEKLLQKSVGNMTLSSLSQTKLRKKNYPSERGMNKTAIIKEERKEKETMKNDFYAQLKKKKQFYEQFIYIIKQMRSRSKGQKSRKDCKSADKRSGCKKNELQLYVNRDMEEVSKSRGLSSKYRDVDRLQARSQQSSRKSQRKHSIDLVMPNKRVCLDQWESQLKAEYREKPCRSNFQILHVIGKGGFGKVWRVEDKKTGHVYAMKQMSKAVILTKKSMESVINQRQLLTRMKHKFIVCMRQAFQDRENLYLVMELMTGGDLRYHICKKHRFTEQQTRFFAACIFSGLEYMHSKRIIHRDIKPQNLVLDDKGYIHLTDLGIAKYLKENNFTDTSGTPGYMAPEVMCRQNHSFEVDFYALGVILYELMMGKRPYLGRSRKQIRQQILSRQCVIKKTDIPDGWSVEAADFINKLIQRKPMMRLGWGGPQEVKNHVWLRSFPWQLLLTGSLQSPFRPYSKYNPAQVRYQPTKEDEEMNQLIKENKILLRKSSVQKIFFGYTFDDSVKENENHTTSSELGRKKEEEKFGDLI